MTNNQIEVIKELFFAAQDSRAQIPVTYPAVNAIGTALDYIQMFATSQYPLPMDRARTMQWAEDVVTGRLGESAAHVHSDPYQTERRANRVDFLNGLLVDFFTAMLDEDFESVADTGALISGIRVFEEGSDFDEKVTNNGDIDAGLQDILWAAAYVGKPEIAPFITQLYKQLGANV